MDYLYGTPYEINQLPDAYHFSSDTELLGRFLSLNEDDRVLDVGTNNGALLCYAAVQDPEILCGIDLFPEITDTAKENLERCGIKAEIATSSLQAFRHDPFTVIMCNPPYFDSLPPELKNKNPYLYAARHRDYLSVFELFMHSARLLEQGGRLMLVFPSDDADDVFTAAGENAFTLTRFCPVYDRQEGSLKRLLFEFTYGVKDVLKLLKPVYLDSLHNDLVQTDLYSQKTAE